MATIELQLGSAGEPLSVRRFAVREALSSTFEVSVWALSADPFLDFNAVVGQPAGLRLLGRPPNGRSAERHWSGVCSFIEQVESETTGLSTYHLRIVPALWLLSQRSNYRVFQHLSVPEIVTKVLADWSLRCSWRVDPPRHPKLEYRVQHAESDLAFVSRLLEEGGISFSFSEGDGEGDLVVCDDAPNAREARSGGAIRFVQNPSPSLDDEFVTNVQLSEEVRIGKVKLRDFDFRRHTTYQLVGEAAAGSAVEDRLEHYHYSPGASLVEGRGLGDTPVADARGAARSEDQAAHRRAEDNLLGERASKRKISFRTNVLDLSPGTVFATADHPRPELSGDAKLLVTSLAIQGTNDGEWAIQGQAVLASQRYVPARRTPKPQVFGVESAVVVGPPRQAIHTDEFGRVQVQFHWDREGTYDDRSSCWMRVSQGWAGTGFGMMAIPRVGQEVLVSFFGGDPDQPVIVGRVFNGMASVPFKLPEHKTVSTWRSDSSPGSDGFNEIRFEDAKGSERVYMQAERDLERLVKVDELITVGGSRTKVVAVNESESTGVNRTVSVGVSRTTAVGAVDATLVGARHSVTMAQQPNAAPTFPATGLEMVDGKIVLTTGEATLTLEGPNITLNAAASILLSAAADVTVTGKAHIKVMAGASVHIEGEDGDVVIQGGPMVRINPEDYTRRKKGESADPPMPLPPGVDLDDNLDEAEEMATFDPDAPSWLNDQLKPGGGWDPLQWGAEHRDFGNFHLGLMASAAGLPAGVLLRQAGTNCAKREGTSPEHGDPGNGLWGGRAPYGNRPSDEDMIRKGAAHYDKHYR